MISSGISISTEKSKLDILLIHEFLTNSYWAKGRTRDQVNQSIEHSMCFGVYNNERQIGFARIITDQIFFGYIADLFIVESHRGQGISKMLLNSIFSNPDLSSVNNWYLFTKDAQGLYVKFNFKEFDNKETSFMEMISI